MNFTKILANNFLKPTFVQTGIFHSKRNISSLHSLTHPTFKFPSMISLNTSHNFLEKRCSHNILPNNKICDFFTRSYVIRSPILVSSNIINKIPSRTFLTSQNATYYASDATKDSGKKLSFGEKLIMSTYAVLSCFMYLGLIGTGIASFCFAIGSFFEGHFIFSALSTAMLIFIVAIFM